MMLCVIAVVVAVDQVTKLWIVANFRLGELRPVISGLFDLTYTLNRGAAFGIFSGVSDGLRQIVLAITTAVALLAVLYFLSRDFRGRLHAQVALALILGGAIGNLIDRVRIGAVIDFLDFYVQNYHWPAFNVADSCICIGVFVLILLRPNHKIPES
ncbi:MAG: signal peptidase II [Oligoflexia bacterium]|nr:signal peptidase II [Oligoflexia bacterium]